jgi:HAD superfamily hydrolase (TIGR01549 family)
MNPKNKTLVIDCDGNLIDTVSYMTKMAKELPKRYGIKAPKISTIRKGYFMIYRLNKERRGMFSFFRTLFEISKILKYDLLLMSFFILSSIYYYGEFRRNPKFVPGAIETLKKIKKKGSKIVLVSVGFKNDINLSIKKIGDLFDLVICKEDTENLRPAPDLIVTVCKTLNLNPREVIYVGDMEEDIKMAKSVGATSVFHVRTSRLLKFDIEEVPDYKIDKISELLKIIEP